MTFRSGVYDLERGIELVMCRVDKEAVHGFELNVQSLFGKRAIPFDAAWAGGRGPETEWYVSRNSRVKNDRFWSTFEPMIEDALRAFSSTKTPGRIVFARQGQTHREWTQHVLDPRPPKADPGFRKGVYDLERDYELVERENDFRHATLQLRGKREMLTFALVQEIEQLQVHYRSTGEWAPLIAEALGPWSGRLGREIVFTHAPHEP